MIAVRNQTEKQKSYTGELQAVLENAIFFLCQNELDYKPLIQAIKKNWVCEKGGSQWHLAILISALVAGQVPTEPRTLLK